MIKRLTFIYIFLILIGCINTKKEPAHSSKLFISKVLKSVLLLFS